MRIPTQQRHPWRRILPLRLRQSRIARALMLCFLLGIAFSAGVVASVQGWPQNAFERGLNVARYSVRRALAEWKADPLQVIIDVKHKNLQKLSDKRDEALSLGILLSSPDDFVSSKISIGSDSVSAKIRLKGDWVDHLSEKKWSFRVQVQGDHTLLGMKQFSLQHPWTRNYLYEWLFHKALRREDIIALRYEFLRVTVNGEDWGVYALEEHFEKRLIEYNRRREGPILRFNESLLWEHKARKTGRKYSATAYYSANIDTFQLNRTLASDTQHPQFVKAVQLLEAFRHGERTVAEVFDTERLARFYALSDLMGAQHMRFFHNLRFYYNPVTSRLEPIGFDADAGSKITSLLEVQEREDASAFYDFGRALFSDTEFISAYHRALERFSSRSYLDSLLADVDEPLRRNLRIIQSEFPSYDFDINIFYANQRLIRDFLRPVKGLHAYAAPASNGQANGTRFHVANIQSLPLEIIGVSFGGDSMLAPVTPLRLAGKLPNTPMRFHDLVLPAAKDTPGGESPVVHYRVAGLDDVLVAKTFPWSPVAPPRFLDDPTRMTPNASEFDFVAIDEATRTIQFRTGRWTIDRDLVLPSGFEVAVDAGTELDLVRGAKLISRSPLRWTGLEEAPIIVGSSDGTGQGVAVIGPGAPSVLVYVVFRNLAEPKVDGWGLTGAVTFYEAPVSFLRCVFQDSRAEDALNIIRSSFKLNRSLFMNTYSDALDVDFSDGEIVNTTFLRTGNDAIDASGSRLKLEHIRVQSPGDKALSAGEASEIEVRNMEIVDAEIGVASKDLSKVSMSDVRISGSRLGFTVYQKKPEFGPGTIRAQKLEIANVERPYAVEAGSTLVVNNRTIAPTGEKVKEMLYGAEYGKATK